MHFAAQFRAATGFRPHEYLLRRRIQRAEELLRLSTMTLVDIALTVGFQTQAHFTTVFKRFVGDTPYQWRNANAVSG
jgi:AraC-like DNA-binding protein